METGHWALVFLTYGATDSKLLTRFVSGPGASTGPSAGGVVYLWAGDSQVSKEGGRGCSPEMLTHDLACQQSRWKHK